jgi:hypothetical protein
MTKPRLLPLLVLAALLHGCTGLGGLKRLPDAQAAIAELQFAKSPLQIAAAADRTDAVYRSGEPIRFSVRLNKPAYLALLEVEKSGETRLLLPNRMRAAALSPPNRALPIPVPREDYEIRAGEPGTFLFEFLASTSGDSWLFRRRPADAATFADLGATTHLLAKEIIGALEHGGAAAAATPVLVRVKRD